MKKQNKKYYQFSLKPRVSLNIWGVIIGDPLVGLQFFDWSLNGDAYLNFLRNDLLKFLENVPTETRLIIWLLQDGYPPHLNLDVRRYLNETFHDKWIGQSGPILRAPRSPDINTFDFFWGLLKVLVYKMPINDIENLREKNNKRIPSHTK